MGEQVDARTAAARLGVDVRTLYAYVSRGALRRVTGPDGRSSRYDSDELELLARRSRPRTLPRPPASIDLVIATQVSTVTDGLIRYRGTDILDLVADREPFEAVAELLWDGRPGPPGQARPAAPGGGPAAWIPAAWIPAAWIPAAWIPAAWIPAAWIPAAAPAASLATLLAGLGDGLPVVHRLAVVVAALPAGRLDAGAAAPARPDWPAWGRRIIAALVQASGPAAGGAGAGAGAVAARLWQRWSPLRPAADRVRALNTALVLLAEHELATSTLAVRVAASGRATPAGCVLAGLGALSGALHGDVPRRVREQLLHLQAGDRPAGNGGAPGTAFDLGFGHPVHRHGDPRAAPLLRAVHAIATPADRELIEQATGAAAAPANVDFALGALCHVARMPPQAATAIFAVARTAGWIAHAAEEYGEPALRFRGRAIVRRPASPA